MKNRHSSTVAAIAAINVVALLVSPKLTAQDSFEAGPQAVTVALTGKFAVPALFELDENGKPVLDDDKQKIPTDSTEVNTLDKNGNVTRTVQTQAQKILTFRYGNAQILQELKDTSLDGTVAGWALISFSDGAGSYQLIARKKGLDDVDLGAALSISPAVSSYTVVETTANTYDKEGSPLTTTVTGSGTYVNEGTAEASVDALGVVLGGPCVENLADFRYYPDSTDKSSQEVLTLSKGARAPALAGIGDNLSVTGSVTVGPSTQVKIKL